jgi:hypothetical protein
MVIRDRTALPHLEDMVARHLDIMEMAIMVDLLKADIEDLPLRMDQECSTQAQG